MRLSVLGSRLAMMASLAGCVQQNSYNPRPVTLRPETATVAATDRTLVWRHAVVALLDEGYVPQVLDESAGYISAARREDLVNDVLTGSLATVVVSPEGVVRVEVSGVGLYGAEKALADALIERQVEIMQAILRARPPAK